MKLGIEILLENQKLQNELQGRRVSLLAHPASICRVKNNWMHTVDALMKHSSVTLSSAFGPQHGMRGDKQDNMVESEDYVDPAYQFPVFSLYGDVRRPTQEMLDTFDVILIDLQDLGTRIYTFLTTTCYILEAAATNRKEVWILDRPNPAGRTVEGLTLKEGWESFVGIGPIMLRHGLTLAECARWYCEKKDLDVNLKIISMEDYKINEAPGFGWPTNERPWINPSPNAASLNMARAFPGTVLFEGTTFSEGRGTTTALELVGAPDLDIHRVLDRMYSLQPDWMKGSYIRPCYFEPTFHKHVGKLCQGFQFHTDTFDFNPEEFKVFRVCSLFLKSVRDLYPDYPIWRNHAYEYENERLAIDLINGSPLLREWVDSPDATPEDFENLMQQDEIAWREEIRKFLLY